MTLFVDNHSFIKLPPILSGNRGQSMW